MKRANILPLGLGGNWGNYRYPFAHLGALDGGPQCHMSILRNGNVPCRYFCNFHVDFKIAKCPLSNLRKGPCHVSNIYSHVDKVHVTCDFKKCPCRPVDFKGQGPSSWIRGCPTSQSHMPLCTTSDSKSKLSGLLLSAGNSIRPIPEGP